MRVLGAAAMAILMGAGGAAAAEGCAGDMPSVCLQSFGAGALGASESAREAGCAARLQAYRSCIADLVSDSAAAPSGPAYSRAEIGFLSALEAEFAENVGRVGEFVDNLDLTGAKAVYKTDWPELRLRFFNATDNPSYFAAPADWLARAQGFYDDLQRLLTRDDVRFAYRRQTSSVLYDRRRFKDAFLDQMRLARQELLPQISAELDAAKR